MKRWLPLFTAVSILFSGIAIAADDSLVVYSGRSDKFVKPVAEAFTKKTGIKITLHSGNSTALLNKLNLEGKRTDADLYLSNDAGNLQHGADKGLFRAVPNDIASRVPANYRSANNDWIGLSARGRVLVANTKSDLVKGVDSVFDLADPKLKNHIGITNSSNGSFIAGVTVYMETAGMDKTRQWLEGLQKNAGNDIFSKHSKIVAAVASGKLDVGLVNHYYIYRHLAKEPNAPIRIVLPDQGANDIGLAWNVAGIAISKYTDNKAAAEKFVDFLTSEEGQKMFAEVNLEYPTRPGVAAAQQVPAAGTYKVANVPMALLGKKRDATLDLLQEVDMP